METANTKDEREKMAAIELDKAIELIQIKYNVKLVTQVSYTEGFEKPTFNRIMFAM